MHDGQRDYCIVYDEDSDPSAARCGDKLIMAAWPNVYASPDEYGLKHPALVQQFLAPSWEQAMQHWYDLRGNGQYWVRCQDQAHEGHGNVKWVNDDYQCAPCAVKAKINKVAAGFVGAVVTKQVIENIKAAVVLKVMRAGGLPTIKNWTASSTRALPDRSCLEFWFQTEQDGGSHTVRLHMGVMT